MVIVHSYVSFPDGTYHFFKAYVSGLHFREYPHKIWSEIWYSTSILGS